MVNMYVYFIYIYVYIYICLYTFRHICLSIHMFIYAYLYTYLFIGNSETFYLSRANAGVGILYDLEKFHRITDLYVQSYAGSDAPKRCLLQLQLSMAAGE
jgi:hypothetical protein